MDADTVWKLHDAARDRPNSNTDYNTARAAGRSNDYSDILPNLQIFGNGFDISDPGAKHAAKVAKGENEVHLQQRVSEQLLQIYRNREGAPNADARSRVEAERLLKATLQVASAQGVTIQMRLPNDVYAGQNTDLYSRHY